MNSQPSAQRRRSPSKRQVPPEVYELLKRTHRALKRSGFLVKADPLNLGVDGRSWVLRVEPTDEVQKGKELDIARSVLESEGVKIDQVYKLENQDQDDRTFEIALSLPPQRAVPPAEAQSDVDHRSERLHKIYGLDPAFLSTPVSSNREITEEYMRTHGGEGPTLEYVMGEAARQAKKLFADCVPGTSPPKTQPSESEIASGPLQSDTQDAGSSTLDRESRIRPMLNERGWSVNDWAHESKVDSHTARDYLKGKTNSYPHTRKKLAESLKISVNELPD